MENIKIRIIVPVYNVEEYLKECVNSLLAQTHRNLEVINLTYSDIAREYLLREGLPAERVIKTGSPMFEVLNS